MRVFELLCSALCVSALGCATPPEPARPTPFVPPLVEPIAFRIETVLFDLPLSLAEELHRPAHEREATICVLIDETGARERLEDLARDDPAVVRAARPDLVVEPGAIAPVPTRVATPLEPARSKASDFIALQVRPTISYDWQPFDLELRIDWYAPSGRSLAKLPSSTSPVPKDHWLRFVCLPSKLDGGDNAASKARAVFGFFRVRPILPETAGAATGG